MAIPIPHQDAAMNQDGRSFSNLKYCRKKEHVNNIKTLSQECLKLF